MSGDGEIVDPPMEGLQSKGLKKGSISLIGAVAIGLAATAPAYSLIISTPLFARRLHGGTLPLRQGHRRTASTLSSSLQIPRARSPSAMHAAHSLVICFHASLRQQAKT
jgi:hypothetical protein